MAYYSYKSVLYTPEYKEAKKELEAIKGKEFDDDPSYDGDAWLVRDVGSVAGCGSCAGTAQDGLPRSWPQ